MKILTLIPILFSICLAGYKTDSLWVTKYLKLRSMGVIDSTTPEYYGAVGDSTTICTDAFRDAVTNSDIVYLRKGAIYLIDSTITLRSNLTICGEGKIKIKSGSFSSATPGLLYLSSGTNCIIKDITIDINSNTFGFWSGAIQFGYLPTDTADHSFVTNSRVENVKISDIVNNVTVTQGINFICTKNCKADNNTIKNARVYVLHSCKETKIINNVINIDSIPDTLLRHDAINAVAYSPFMVDNEYSSNVISCKNAFGISCIYRNALGYDTTMGNNGNYGSKIYNNIVRTKSTTSDKYGWGMSFDNCTDVSVVNNEFYCDTSTGYRGSYGIEAPGNIDCRITGNKVYGYAIGIIVNGSDTLSHTRCDNVSVSDNKITNCKYGIYLYRYTNYVSCINNRIYMQDSTARYGIYRDATALSDSLYFKEINVSQNNIYIASTTACQGIVISGDGLNCIGNNIYMSGAAHKGIYFGTVKNATFSLNNIYGDSTNNQTGIYDAGATSSQFRTISSNNFKNCLTNDIYIANSNLVIDKVLMNNNISYGSGASSINGLTLTEVFGKRKNKRYSYQGGTSAPFPAVMTFTGLVGDIIYNQDASKKTSNNINYIIDGWVRVTDGLNNVEGTDWIKVTRQNLSDTLTNKPIKITKDGFVYTNSPAFTQTTSDPILWYRVLKSNLGNHDYANILIKWNYGNNKFYNIRALCQFSIYSIGGNSIMLYPFTDYNSGGGTCPILEIRINKTVGNVCEIWVKTEAITSAALTPSITFYSCNDSLQTVIDTVSVEPSWTADTVVVYPSNYASKKALVNTGSLVIGDSTHSKNALKTTRLYYGIAKGDSSYSIKDTSKILRSDSAYFGKVGIGIDPSAYLHVKAGTATAGTAPIKLVTGTLLTVPEAGTVEFAGEKLYFTCVGTQRVIDRTSDVKLTSDTVVNTTDETTIYTAAIPANSLRAGNILKMNMSGDIDETAAADVCTIRVKFGGVTIASIDSPGSGLSLKHWHIKGQATLQAIGAGGIMAWHLDMDAGGDGEDDGGVSAVNTTIAENVTVTAQWNNAKLGNIFICDQGVMEYKN